MGVHYPNVLNDVSACARGERGEEEGELTVAVGIGQCFDVSRQLVQDREI